MTCALETGGAKHFLSAVLRDRVRQGLWTGLIAAAATAGTLVGFGLARGAPVRPLNAVAHILLGTRALVFDSFDLAVTGTALALHMLSLLAWGVLFVLLAARFRGIRLIIAAIVFAAGAFAVDYYVLPSRFRPGFESTLSGAEVAAVYLVLALALVIGLTASRPSPDIA